MRLEDDCEDNLDFPKICRNITYRIVFENHVNKHLYADCIVGLDQVLPAGLSAIPKNRVNVELPAEESQPTSVYIISKLVDGQATLLAMRLNPRGCSFAALTRDWTSVTSSLLPSYSYATGALKRSAVGD
ncbi:Chemokine C-X-C motif receptor 4 [Operophtera brumata]|uniref:Chemokine C-X-C motif receptor 4 n=1 Tax=Operophtera brumata TaxID=104452 RepID=A0A0L7LNB1_OPEBR|nr:Chemokine C-X-C motif receptor 4 [Operophtera brumata]